MLTPPLRKGFRTFPGSVTTHQNRPLGMLAPPSPKSITFPQSITTHQTDPLTIYVLIADSARVVEL